MGLVSHRPGAPGWAISPVFPTFFGNSANASSEEGVGIHVQTTGEGEVLR